MARAAQHALVQYAKARGAAERKESTTLEVFRIVGCEQGAFIPARWRSCYRVLEDFLGFGIWHPRLADCWHLAMVLPVGSGTCGFLCWKEVLVRGNALVLGKNKLICHLCRR